MKTGTCQSCHTAVAQSQAVIRSMSLRQVFFHRHCWEKIHGPITASTARWGNDY